MVHRDGAYDADDTSYPKPEPEPNFTTTDPVPFIEDAAAFDSVDKIDQWILENERATVELRRAIARIGTATNRLRALRDEYLDTKVDTDAPLAAEQSFDDDHGTSAT